MCVKKRNSTKPANELQKCAMQRYAIFNDYFRDFLKKYKISTNFFSISFIIFK